MASDAPYHAHIYFTQDQETAAAGLRERLRGHPEILFVGEMTADKAGPHPIPQFEVHFLEKALDNILTLIEGSGLRTLVHPLTDDDMADHTTLARWIGEPIPLDLSTLDPPGMNQGVARFGINDF